MAHILPIKKKGVSLMLKTAYTRKLDTVGRLMIPSKLREELHMVNGHNYEFYIDEVDGKTFLCIECPEASDAVALAKETLEQNGYRVIKE